MQVGPGSHNMINHGLRGLVRDCEYGDMRAKQGGSLYDFYEGLLYDPVLTRTHDVPHGAGMLTTKPSRSGTCINQQTTFPLIQQVPILDAYY